jgi:hypothetical protein
MKSELLAEPTPVPHATISDAQSLIAEDRQLACTKFMTASLTVFSLFAVFPAMAGIYGVVAFAVQQRDRETAIRVALGATRSSISNRCRAGDRVRRSTWRGGGAGSGRYLAAGAPRCTSAANHTVNEA